MPTDPRYLYFLPYVIIAPILLIDHITMANFLNGLYRGRETDPSDDLPRTSPSNPFKNEWYSFETELGYKFEVPGLDIAIGRADAAIHALDTVYSIDHSDSPNVRGVMKAYNWLVSGYLDALLNQTEDLSYKNRIIWNYSNAMFETGRGDRAIESLLKTEPQDEYHWPHILDVAKSWIENMIDAKQHEHLLAIWENIDTYRQGKELDLDFARLKQTSMENGLEDAAEILINLLSDDSDERHSFINRITVERMVDYFERGRINLDTWSALVYIRLMMSHWEVDFTTPGINLHPSFEAALNASIIYLEREYGAETSKGPISRDLYQYVKDGLAGQTGWGPEQIDLVIDRFMSN